MTADQCLDDEILNFLPKCRYINTLLAHYLKNCFQVTLMANAHIFIILIEDKFVRLFVYCIVC